MTINEKTRKKISEVWDKAVEDYTRTHTSYSDGFMQGIAEIVSILADA